eukprot:scaffold21914_cov68-Phaeocystis_antarctica.AAC.4
MAVVFKYFSLFRQEIRLANAYRPPTPCMYSFSSEAGGRGDLFRADVDAAPLAARGVCRAARLSENSVVHVEILPLAQGAPELHGAGLKSGDRSVALDSALKRLDPHTGVVWCHRGQDGNLDGAASPAATPPARRCAL